MGNSVLAGCGRYSDKLTEISKTLVENKIKSGEKISENEEKLKKTQEEYDGLQDILNTRLVQIYETPKLQFLQVY